ncbi:MAG: hypothetical protein NVSMB46_00060 [Candidatus Saccharimonadales bacterium]
MIKNYSETYVPYNTFDIDTRIIPKEAITLEAYRLLGGMLCSKSKIEDETIVSCGDDALYMEHISDLRKIFLPIDVDPKTYY